MTLGLPYYEKTDAQVVDHVLRGEIPRRPSASAESAPCDKLWLFMKSCWNNDPELRPEITAVIQELGRYWTPATRHPSYVEPSSLPSGAMTHFISIPLAELER